MHTLSFQIQEPLLAELESLAKKTERSRSYLVRKAVEIYLEEQRDLLAAEQALHTLENSADKSTFILSQIKAENDL
jgi:RHH-type rel operon transcriptional repressor/antitoxin RelB